jgi:hypothetical protein
MRYSSQKSYRDSMMVEVQKVIDSLEEKKKRKSIIIFFIEWLKKFFKLLK